MVERMNAQYVDPKRWPHLVAPLEAHFQGRRAEEASKRLEALAAEYDLSLTGATTPFLDVHDGELFDRIVAHEWLGVAESYMLGQWDAEPLPEVLEILLQQNLEGRLGALLNRKRKHGNFGAPLPGEVPDGLVELYAGETRATGAALFKSAARTTTTESVSVPVSPGAKKTTQLTLDLTYFGAPDNVDRQDLDDAQMRRIESMLDEAGVGPGDRVLELTSSGGTLAIQAAKRGASVDVLTSDAEHAETVGARVRAAGVAGAVRIEKIVGSIPSPRQWSGSYDVIFSIERMETLGRAGIPHFLRAIDRMLARGGVAVVQSIVSTPTARETAKGSLDVMRAYVWPALEYPLVDEVRAATLSATKLNLVAENYLGSHLAATLPLWRSNFLARERQAAAAGFDLIFRRLWDYQLALHQALMSAGDIDCVQFVFEPRS
ncbi:class I SAM-dependent methyltransferase [Corynebacterium auriscanis]|uniref:class I SAM-dependent methyltransferase n=2 Tax=Corynebacterium auriscanis TaxID=99807 RepID=UPI003CEE830D